MVPSLFPMLIVAGFASSCRCPQILQKWCAAPLQKLFGLSSGCLTPLMTGLLCGYPMAAKAASVARSEGLITTEDARRLTLCFTCPGAPFAVVVAGRYFHSRAIGVTLLFSCTAADALAAFLLRRTARLTDAKPPANAATACKPPSERLVIAVDGAVKSMASICAWIGAFYTLIGVFNAATGGRAETVVALTAEITGAIGTAAADGNVPLTAACLSFGGICVFCQLLPMLNACGAGAARFLLIRSFCAGTAYLIQTALLRLLPVPILTQTRLGGFYLTANSVAGSVALLFLCAVFMAETAKEKKWGR